MEERYLGDGVYASFDGYHIWLHTKNNTEQRIALEPAVYNALVAYRNLVVKNLTNNQHKEPA